MRAMGVGVLLIMFVNASLTVGALEAPDALLDVADEAPPALTGLVPEEPVPNQGALEEGAARAATEATTVVESAAAESARERFLEAVKAAPSPTAAVPASPVLRLTTLLAHLPLLPFGGGDDTETDPSPHEAARAPQGDPFAPSSQTDAPMPSAAALILVAGAAATGAAFLPGVRASLAGPLRALLGLGLFTRIAQEDLLDHPRRSEILDYVRQNPGERLETVRRALGVENGPFSHHVRMLEGRNLVKVRREGGLARLYPAGGPRIQPTPYLGPIERELLARLQARPGQSQRQIARALGWSERVVSYHVRHLDRKGLVVIERDGPTKRCFPNPS